VHLRAGLGCWCWLQLLALIAMECPVSNHPDDIRDEKCKVLRCIAPLKMEDVVLGQYTAGGPANMYLFFCGATSGTFWNCMLCERHLATGCSRLYKP
jgi:hypothetical protein